MKFEIPVNLRVKQYIDYNSNENTDRMVDGMHYVCHVINQLMVRLDDKMCFHGSSYRYGVPLNSTLLKKVLGREYKKVIQLMVDNSIIETNDYYEPGKSSKLYRFTSKYRFSKRRWISPTSKKFLKLNPEPGYVRNTGVYIYEKQLINRLKKMGSGLTIDTQAAHAWVDCYYNEQLSRILKGTKKYRQKRLLKLRLKCRGYRENIRVIAEGYMPIYQDEFGHRLHTPLSRLKKELRRFISYQGKPLVEVDMANSQLYFLLPLLKWEIYTLKGKKRQGTTLKDTIWLNNNKVYHYSNTIMWCKSLERQYSKGFQELDFVTDACKGTIYEKVAEQLATIGFFKKQEDHATKRAVVKKYLLKLIFASPTENSSMYSGRYGAIWSAFKTIYPEVSRIVELIKEVDYKQISGLLQRIESYCMIRGVCKTVNKRYPDIPLFTIHDCIVTTAEHVSTVKATLLSVIKEIIGYSPTVKGTAWGIAKKKRHRLKFYLYQLLYPKRRRAA